MKEQTPGDEYAAKISRKGTKSARRLREKYRRGLILWSRFRDARLDPQPRLRVAPLDRALRVTILIRADLPRADSPALETDPTSVPRNGREAVAFGYAYSGSPIVMTEFGGISYRVGEQKSANEWGYSGIEPTKEAFLTRLEGLVRALRSNKAIAGYCYTQLTDVEQEINGLMTSVRRLLESTLAQAREARRKGLPLEEAQRTIDLESFRKQFAGDDPSRNDEWTGYFRDPAVASVYAETAEYERNRER